MEGFPYVDITQAAKLTGFTAGYIRRLIHEDQIDAYKLTKNSPFLWLDEKAVEYLKSRANGGSVGRRKSGITSKLPHQVYVLRQYPDPRPFYVGVSTDLNARLIQHRSANTDVGRRIRASRLETTIHPVSDLLNAKDAYQFERDLIRLLSRNGVKLLQSKDVVTEAAS